MKSNMSNQYCLAVTWSIRDAEERKPLKFGSAGLEAGLH